MDTVPEDAPAEAPEGAVVVVAEGPCSVLRPRRSNRLQPPSPSAAEGSDEQMTASKGAGQPSPDTIGTSGRGSKVRPKSKVTFIKAISALRLTSLFP